MIDNKKIYIKSYGCQMNVYDSDRIKNLFENKGYSETKNIKEASLIVLNTCHIREKASEKDFLFYLNHRHSSDNRKILYKFFYYQS